MDTKQKLQLMMDRFVHPNSKFAEQVFVAKDTTRADGSIKRAGTYFFPVRRGDCTHTPRHKSMKECSDCVDVPFTNKFLRQHLMGDKTFAPYQMSEDGTVKYVCLDIDGYSDVKIDDTQKMTIEVVKKVNARLGRGHCLVEHSGSKGYHVWIFFTAPVPVSNAYALGHDLTHNITLMDDLNIEVYPKQQSNNKVFGNTIKIPLGVHQKTGQRCFFVKGDFTPHEDQWKVLSEVKTVDPSWVYSNVKKIERFTPATDQSGEYRKYTADCLTEIMEEGCSEGVRDEAAFRIASYFNAKDIPEYMARESMEQWNKMNHPPLDDEDLDLKINSAYKASYPWKPCHLPVFDKHCHSSCVFFERKVERRWFSEEESPIGKISRD